MTTNNHCSENLNAHPSKLSRRLTKKRRSDGVLRKAPQAPRRFKSSYILFFMAKQNEIKLSLPSGSSVGDVSKKSSQMWRALTPEERAYWDDCAEQDKQRYLKEKNAYTGPWQVPYQRPKKNPRAPKRPMSSFLFFSKARRQAIKDEFPNMKNTEISSMLGEQWRNATEEERRPHIEMELRERNKYKLALEEFNLQEIARKQREDEEEAAAIRMEANEKIRMSADQAAMAPYPIGSSQQSTNAPAMQYQQHQYDAYSNSGSKVPHNSNSNVSYGRVLSPIQHHHHHMYNTPKHPGAYSSQSHHPGTQTIKTNDAMADFEHPFLYGQDPFAIDLCS